MEDGFKQVRRVLQVLIVLSSMEKTKDYNLSILAERDSPSFLTQWAIANA